MLTQSSGSLEFEPGPSLLERSADRDGGALEVDVAPPQRQHLAAAKPGRDRDRRRDLAEYALDDVVQLDAQAAAGSTFVGWSGDLAGEEDPALLTVTGAMRVTATFATAAQVPGLGPAGLALVVALLGATAVLSLRRRAP
jgi:hypothetical protein